MQALERFDGGEGAPVDRHDLPHGDGPQDAADAVAEEADRYNTEYDSCRVERHVVEYVLRGEDGDSGGGVKGRGGGDGAYRVLLEVPPPIVEEGNGPDPLAGLEAVTAREDSGPRLAKEVGDKDDKGALDGDEGWFTLRGSGFGFRVRP